MDSEEKRTTDVAPEMDYDWKLRKEAEFWGKMARVRWEGGIPMTMDFSLATRYRVRRAALGWGDYFQDPLLESLTPYGRAKIRFVRKARSVEGSRALDLGCGAGWLALELARSGKSVDALDISEEEQTVAREYQATLTEEVPGSINWICTDLNQHKTDELEYDVVTAWDALHHIQNLKQLYEEIDKALKPGGHFLVSERVWGTDKPSVRARIGKYLELFVWSFLPTPSPYTYRRKFKQLFGELGLFFRTKILRQKVEMIPWQLDSDDFCSPFEEASGREIVDLIEDMFEVEKIESYGGFTEEIQRSLYLPRFLRFPVLLFLSWLDHAAIKLHLLEGKVSIIYARKKGMEQESSQS